MESMFVWRREDVEGIGTVAFMRCADGFRLLGHEATVAGGLRFEISVDDAWHTRSVEVVSTSAHGAYSLRLDVWDGRWHVDGVLASELDGCVDVELFCVPVTNTLPIRRLALADGERADVRAVWIGAPELELEVLEQQYARVGAGAEGSVRYEYRVLGSPGTTWMTVDEQGFVIDYENFATRIHPMHDQASRPGSG